MILYNIRYRGPYEYDKFILNTFQLCNEVRRMRKNVQEKEESRLLIRERELDKILEQESAEDSRLSEVLLLRERMGDIR